MIRALHAAEAGLDGLLQVLNDRNCGDGACVSTMQVQRDILQWVYNGGQGAYPSGAPPFLSSPSH